jgi:predicted Zn-dependent peptidase
MNGKTIKTSISYTTLLFIVLLLTGRVFAATAPADFPLPSPDKIKYPPLHFNLPQTQRVVLENGIVLYILEDHELPLISVNALIKTGSMYDPEGKEGIAQLTAYVMRTGGTIKLSSTEIDNRFDFLAASPSISMAMESASIDFSFLGKDLDQSLDLLAQILIQPAFEQNKFILARELKNEDLRRIKDDPQRLAFREFNRLVYRNNPRGSFASMKSLSKIERNDLITFHKQFFSPDKIMFAVTGDITKELAINKINQYFGKWKTNGSATKAPILPQNTNGGLYYIDKEITQSTIICGELSVSKNNPDFYAFTILDFIIGSGGFPSLIFSAVRNNEGLAYSAGSFYRAKPDYGIFGAYAFTKTESSFKTLNLINTVLKKAKSGTITNQEINWAKKSINNGFIFSFLEPRQIALQQMKLEYDQLPDDYLLSYRDKIENVKASDINRVAAKYLDENNRVFLILGDTKRFGKPSTHIGKPVVINPAD